MGDKIKVQVKMGAVWRTVGKPRSNVSVAFDQFKATVRNGQQGKQYRMQRGKQTLREATAL
jgi:hypothetical protein